MKCSKCQKPIEKGEKPAIFDCKTLCQKCWANRNNNGSPYSYFDKYLKGK